MTKAEKLLVRRELGKLMKEDLERAGRDANWLSHQIHVKPVVVRHMLNGAPNPTRLEYEKAFSRLELPRKRKHHMLYLLDVFSPSKPIREFSRSDNSDKIAG